MCGIVGYVGQKEAAPILMSGLKKLEYRGYDSAGIAVSKDHTLNVVKKQGKLDNLAANFTDSLLEGQIGIGHTRWATHGRPTDYNSHPHYDEQQEFMVVHNGIIENYQELKENLKQKGYNFTSETDTEVIPHLLRENYRGDVKQALLDVVGLLEGSYALAVLCKNEPGKIFAVRQDSPLIVGQGDAGENFIASDIPAFLEFTDDFFILDDGEIAEVTDREINLYDQQGQKVEKDIFKVDWDAEMAEKQGYEHYMLKEIKEQPDALRRILNGRVVSGEINLEEIKLPDQINKIHIVACGTASYAGRVGKYILEELAHIPAEISIASEFRYREPLIDEQTLVIVVSQSGETADTLAGLRLAQKKGAQVLALTNVVGSSIDREADQVFHLKAGPEIAVASTKAYVTMLTSFYLLGLHFARQRDTITEERASELIEDLVRLPKLASRVINQNESKVKSLADKFKDSEHVFFIGRNTDYTLALEGALKLKEISYIHAEAYAAGELKHGTLALIEDGVPVVAIATREGVFDKMLSNIQEVKAREADVLALTYEGAEGIVTAGDDVIYIPDINGIFSGVLAIIPLQLLAYYTARKLGCDVDQPRNLAKSVTVE
ncbi:MAG: glutamine--fructose-6-phosphate transaminase (isomerizing) [Halanaerobiaceae bacterium]